MKESAPTLLAALWGKQRVTVGLDAPEELRRLSDDRALTCPGCGGVVVFRAGTVRAHHFAHLPGAVCTLPSSEPETEEHRAGKLLLAEWLRHCLPDAEVIVEAYLPETQQRADLLLVRAASSGRPERFALEYQCANLAAKEWRRRHQLYREAGIRDLWLLGGSRLTLEPPATLRTTELERALLWDGAPLLFLDAVGERKAVGTLARFRPDVDAQAHKPAGRLSAKPLLSLPFPATLFDWALASGPTPPVRSAASRPAASAPTATPPAEYWLWEWLATRFRVTSETLAPFFGLPLDGQEIFRCEARVWQALVYYRFVHQRVGDGWWLAEVETWARAYLPLTRSVSPGRLQGVLARYQEVLAAAGFLSLPMGYGRTNARILADLTTLPAPPDREETLRLARYRRTLMR